MWRNPEHVLRTRAIIERPIDEVFAFFSSAENLARITPRELGFRIVTAMPIEMNEGTLIDYRLSLFGIPLSWRTGITRWNPPHEFEDTQLSGPYAQWIHRHALRAEGSHTIMEDEVRYRLPIPLVGVIAYPLVRLQLARIFSYRARRIRDLLGV